MPSKGPTSHAMGAWHGICADCAAICAAIGMPSIPSSTGRSRNLGRSATYRRPPRGLASRNLRRHGGCWRRACSHPRARVGASASPSSTRASPSTIPTSLGRTIVTASFVRGETVDDGHGHGTHCAGIACGPANPARLPRYGVAPDADLFVGKVLNNRGSGTDADVLAGINWAVRQGCHVISLSLGVPILPGQGGFSPVFEQTAQRVWHSGALIVAAAGNASARPALVAPVSHPANCPSIMAVAAVDDRARVASFSCAGPQIALGTRAEIDIPCVLDSTGRGHVPLG